MIPRQRMMIGPYIKKRREELGITQLQMGKSLGHRYGNFVGAIEKGQSPFPLEHWQEYADFLQVPRREFLKICLTEIYPNMLPYLFDASRPAPVTNDEPQVDESWIKLAGG